jgi:hypothetical protein
MKLRYETTGEIRPPLQGEWFWGYRGPERAFFDFTVQSFPICREVLEPEEPIGPVVTCDPYSRVEDK